MHERRRSDGSRERPQESPDRPPLALLRERRGDELSPARAVRRRPRIRRDIELPPQGRQGALGHVLQQVHEHSLHRQGAEATLEELEEGSRALVVDARGQLQSMPRGDHGPPSYPTTETVMETQSAHSPGPTATSPSGSMSRSE